MKSLKVKKQNSKHWSINKNLYLMMRHRTLGEVSLLLRSLLLSLLSIALSHKSHSLMPGRSI